MIFVITHCLHSRLDLAMLLLMSSDVQGKGLQAGLKAKIPVKPIQNPVKTIQNPLS